MAFDRAAYERSPARLKKSRDFQLQRRRLKLVPKRKRVYKGAALDAKRARDREDKRRKRATQRVDGESSLVYALVAWRHRRGRILPATFRRAGNQPAAATISQSTKCRHGSAGKHHCTAVATWRAPKHCESPFCTLDLWRACDQHRLTDDMPISTPLPLTSQDSWI